MKMKPVFGLCCALASAPLFAEDVTVPHTFTAGTKAKASEVNENFQTLSSAINLRPRTLRAYIGESLLGEVLPLGTGNSYNIFVTSTEVLGGVGYNGEVAEKQFYYTSNDCSGQPYFQPFSNPMISVADYGARFNGMVFATDDPQYAGTTFYISAAELSEAGDTVNVLSKRTSGVGCEIIDDTATTYYPANVADAQTIGFDNDVYVQGAEVSWKY